MLSAQSRLVDVMAKIDCVKTGADIESDYSCEYDLADAPPFTWPNDPDPDSTEWTRVFGESATGQFMGISWELENPADVATSEDGEYLIIAPVNYRGEFYSDTEIVEKGYYYTRSQFRIQIIKKWE